MELSEWFKGFENGIARRKIRNHRKRLRLASVFHGMHLPAPQ